MSGADVFGRSHPFKSRARSRPVLPEKTLCTFTNTFPFWPDSHIPGWGEERSASLYPLGRGIAPSYLCTRSCTGLNISGSRHREERNRECSNNGARRRKPRMTVPPQFGGWCTKASLRPLEFEREKEYSMRDHWAIAT